MFFSDHSRTSRWKRLELLSASSARSLLGLFTMLAALVTGCGLDSGFQELGDELVSPDIGYIDTPGRQIASGTYHRFSVRAPTLDDRYIVGFEGSNLVMIRFEEHGKKCEVGRGRVFGLSITGEAAGLDDHEPVLPYLVNREANGRGELRFTDFACNVRTLSVPDVPLPDDTLVGDQQYHLIVRNGSRELLAIDPWADEPTVLGTDASYYHISGQRLWSVEQGQLVLRDAALQELGRVGTAITEVRVSRNPNDAWAAFVDGGTLHLVEQNAEGTALEPPRGLKTDACHVAQVSSSRERVLSYFSPCSTRHLVLHDVINEQLVEYVDDVIATGVVLRSATGFDLNYWTGPEGNSGTLWIARSGMEPERTIENALIDTDALFRNWAFAITDWDGETGNYVSWRDGVTTTIAEGVAELNSLGLVANYRDGVGDLLIVRGDDTTFELGTDVPLESTRGRAFIGNASGGSGELFVLDSSGASARSVASGVTPGAFLFSVQIETLLMMLSDFDAARQTATLQVRLLDTGDQFVVSAGVSELVEVGFPRPGLLYGVPEGNRAGLWFAGVR